MVNMRLAKKNSSFNLRRKSDTLLITGDGRCLQTDLSAWEAAGRKDYEIAAIGRSIKIHKRPVRHWINVDGPGSKWWAEHLPHPAVRHTIGECPGYDCVWDDGMPDGEPWYGSSSLFAALIGLILGYKAIILAGCPMDMAGHWYWPAEHPGPEWRQKDYQAWEDFARAPKPGQVTSLSGFTRDVLTIGMEARWQ